MKKRLFIYKMIISILLGIIFSLSIIIYAIYPHKEYKKYNSYYKKPQNKLEAISQSLKN